MTSTQHVVKTSRPWAGFWVGVVTTAVIAGLVGWGADRRVEWLSLDWRTRTFTLPYRSADILHVDIDDNALASMGRWPWPRETLAGIIDVLDECDAEAIGLDLLLPDAQPIRLEAELTGGVRRVADDAILANALAQAGNATLAFTLDFSQPDAGAMGMLAFALPAEVDPAAAPAGKFTPPLPRFAEAIHRAGMATHAPDPDGVTRRVQLLGSAGDRVFGQLGFMLAVESLETTHGPMGNLRSHAGGVVLTFADGHELAIPLDGEGRMLVNYVRGLDYSDHISAGDVGDVVRPRLAAAACRRAKLALLLDIAGPDMLNNPRLLDLAAAREQAQLEETLETAATLLAVEVELAAEAVGFLKSIDEFYLANVLPADDPSYAVYEPLIAARADIAALDESIAALEAQATAELMQLRPYIVGKICLIGSTTTGAADFTATAIDQLTPGVVVHANVLEMVRSGKFLWPTGRAVSVALVVLMGVFTTAVACRGSLLRAVGLAIGIAVIYVALTVVAFAQWGWWLALAGPLVVVVAVLLTVSVFRQLTEQRARKQIRSLFAHAVSGELVDEILADPSVAKLGGQERLVTSFFSDLAGFTCLAEAIGPERTVAMLNEYFDRMTRIIQERFGGYVNKFLGDGLFCLFGAPVVQADHAARAIEAGIACHQALAAFNAELTEAFVLPSDLAMRVGIVTERAMVGNCGSSSRMDYTAIGDGVNLASRLESANKFLGTRILVTQATWESAGAAHSRRRLGMLGIRGVDQAVEACEILFGDEGHCDVSAFEMALADYEAGRIAQAAEIFESLVAACPADRVARIYATLARFAASLRPNDAWQLPERLIDGTVQFRDPR